MLPSIIETLGFNANGWDHQLKFEDAVVFWNVNNDEEQVTIERRGATSYDVTLETEHATVESDQLNAITASATALGFMQNPALFEQAILS